MKCILRASENEDAEFIARYLLHLFSRPYPLDFLYSGTYLFLYAHSLSIESFGDKFGNAIGTQRLFNLEECFRVLHERNPQNFNNTIVAVSEEAGEPIGFVTVVFHDTM